MIHLCIFNVLISKVKNLEFDMNNVRVERYDNEYNMKVNNTVYKKDYQI